MNLTPPRRAALDFLLSHLPASDVDGCDTSLLLSFVDHALALRQSAPWCAALDEELFYHYVLFPRVNDEAVTFHRAVFYDALWERVVACSTMEERILTVNCWCHECATYERQDDRTASPLTVYRAGSGRCGEESTFLVSALRSVGIAARQVYAPRWAHCDDNHAWVEVLCGETWRFLGACEPEPILDRGWFNTAASRALLVHSRLFGTGTHPLHGECIGTVDGVTYYNQTGRYAHTVCQQITVQYRNAPVAEAVVRVQVLNEASFHTIATLHTDRQGMVALTLGQGDIHIVVSFGDTTAECDATVGEPVVLSVDVFHNDGENWGKHLYIAPVDAPLPPVPLTEQQKQQRAETLSRGNTLRTARMSALSSPLCPAARGNASEILRFLHTDENPLRKAMLHTLTEKDYRDATASVLEAHLQWLPAQGDMPDDLYFPYVVCPRIALEPLTAWREVLYDACSTQEREQFCAEPTRLWKMLCETLSPAVTYGNLVWTPETAWRSGRCDEASRRLLFVAFLRTWGVPARLRAIDGAAEYWQNGAWHSIRQENTAVLMITGAETAVYRQDWTLCRWEHDGWTLLREDLGAVWTLPAGEYRLITTVRMPNGNQFAAWRGLTLSAGEQKEVSLFFCSYELSDLLWKQRLPPMEAVTLTGDVVTDLCRIHDVPMLLFWLEDGGEPTAHILHELVEHGDAVNVLPIVPVFLLRGRESFSRVEAALSMLTQKQVLLDDWEYDLEQTARHLTCDPDQPPLTVVLDRSGYAVYGASGYSVGRVPLLLRVAEHLLSTEK